MYNDILVSVCTECLKESVFSTLKYPLPVKLTCPLILETSLNLEGRVVSVNKKIIYPKNLSYNLENKDAS